MTSDGEECVGFMTTMAQTVICDVGKDGKLARVPANKSGHVMDRSNEGGETMM